MMHDTFDTIGVMFQVHHKDRVSDDHEFPTVEMVARTNYLNPYLYDIDDDMDKWLAIAYYPFSLGYSDESHEAMDETNYNAIVEGFEGYDDIPMLPYSRSVTGRDYGVEVAREVGVMVLDHRVLAIDPSRVENVEHAIECLDRLCNHSFLDEEAYSQKEYEAWQEYAPIALSDEVRHSASVCDEMADWITDNADDVLSIVCGYLHYYDGFSGGYGPNMLDIWQGLVTDPTNANDWERERLSELLGSDEYRHALTCQNLAMMAGWSDDEVRWIREYERGLPTVGQLIIGGGW